MDIDLDALERAALAAGGEEWTFDVAIPDRGFCAQVWDADGNDALTSSPTDRGTAIVEHAATASPAAVLELIRRLRVAESRLHEVSIYCANVEAERDALRAELKAMKQQKPIAWRAVGGSIWGHKTSQDDVPLFEAAGAQQPVAWTTFPPSGHYTSLSGEAEKWAANGWSVVPLYLAPVAQPAPSVPDVDALAQFIRETDGAHQLGAGVLAERIVEWIAAAPKPEGE